MRRYFSQHSFGRRITALAAAYTIALAGLVASFDVARATTANGADPSSIICHRNAAGEPGPSTGGGTGSICGDICCTGCVTLLAALPPPPATAVPVMLTPSGAVARVEAPAVVGALKAKSHQSRGPPQNL